jgi:hypothetical protein
MDSNLFGITVRTWYKPSKPERNPQYLRFIRMFPCVCCGANRNIEAAHFGPRGLGQKSSDLTALPLCRWCHRTGPESYHKLGPVKFSLVHGIDIDSLAQIFNQFFQKHSDRVLI